MASNEGQTIRRVDLLRFVKGLLPRADGAIAVAYRCRYAVAINTVLTVQYDCLWRKVSLDGNCVVVDSGNTSSVVDIPLFSSTKRYCSLGHI